jgi:histidinol dehydrogenase
VKVYDWAALSAAERRAALARPAQRRDAKVIETVKRVFDAVDARGEAAVAEFATRFDGAPPRALPLDAETIDAARATVARDDLEALELARANVETFHRATRPVDSDPVETVPGVVSRRVWRPIGTAGLYVPGGSAPLFSTLLMLAIPAAVAGVGERVAVTPPARHGGVAPIVIAAAAASGLDRLTLVGGAQAIAALTFGAGLPRADKLFGPGNAYVTEAKRYAAELPGGPAIDMPAGPSELLVIADETADPARVAADLLSQAEHDADAQVLLVTTSERLALQVARETERQLASLPRAETARASLAEGRVILVRSTAEALEASDAYAPEHLSLQTAEAETLVEAVAAAGTVFVGPWAAETFGDYLSGPSHVLPTDGAARTWSGITVQSFMTSFAVQTVTREGAGRIAPEASRLARLEGLEAHARAADIRAPSRETAAS